MKKKFGKGKIREGKILASALLTGTACYLLEKLALYSVCGL